MQELAAQEAVPELRSSFLREFRADITDVLQWSEKHFGVDASKRHAELVRQAVRDVADDPNRNGSRARTDLGSGVHIYHLLHSRNSVAGEWAKLPRYFIQYRFVAQEVQFGRLLHDSRDLSQHLPAAFY